MNCSKACQEIYIRFFTHYLYEQKLYFMIRLDDDDYSSKINIPKDHLTPELCKSLPTNIQLKGPTGQMHEISTKSTGDVILLATGWNHFISYYSLRRKDVLLFFYEGNSLFLVKMFDQSGCEIIEPRGVGHNAEQIDSRGKNGKGKQVAESEACPGPTRAKSGRIEQKHSIIVIDFDSEGSRDPVKKGKQTTTEQKEISNQSVDNFTQLSKDSDISSSRSVANYGEGPSKGSIAKEKDVSAELGLVNEVATDTEDESCRSDSVYEILAQPPLQREVISISSGFIHENGGLKSRRSPNLPVKKELDNSTNSDSDEAATKHHAKLRFAPRQKPISNKKRSSTASDQAARFRSRNPYFAKQMVESNVREACYMNVFVKFAKEYFPEKHSKITLLLPQGNKTWRVKCGYSCQTRAQWYFCTGWSDFAHENNLEIGNWCVFELTDKKKREMTVHIFK